MQVTFRTGILFLLITLLTVVSAAAEKKYISDNFEVLLRTGPGNERKIIALMPTGKSVDVVDPGDEWSEVIYNDKRGWTETRYLTDKIPAAMALEQLQQKYTALVDKSKTMEERLAQLEKENGELGGELTQAQDNLTELGKAHETLKSESSDYLALKAKYDQAVKEMNAARGKADQIESEFNKVNNSQLNEGLLYGGGLLLLGIVMGFILKRPKRRGPLM